MVRAGSYLAAVTSLRLLAALDASLYTHLYYSALPVHPTARKLVLPMDPDGAALLASFSLCSRLGTTIPGPCSSSAPPPPVAAFVAMASAPRGARRRGRHARP
jgi:chitinase